MVRGGIRTVGEGRGWACTLYREEGRRGAGIERNGDMGGVLYILNEEKSK